MLSTMKRTFLIGSGCLSLTLGVIGIFLPLLPTVPLVLLSAYCFAKSSERLHRWLLQHKYFGKIIRDFEAGKGVPRRVKVRAILLIWVSMGISSWIVARLMLVLMLIAIGMATSIYIWRLPEPESQATS